MKTINEGNGSFRKLAVTFARALIVAGVLFGAVSGFAQAPPPIKSGLPAPLDSWSFADTNYWTSDSGYTPISFTNITWMLFGDGTSLVVNTNVPAWLQYNTAEGGTNEIAVDSGSVTFWYAPDWSSTNDPGGGLGPQEYGRLIEIGGYTPDSSFGLWSIYVDPAGANLYFSSQTNDGSGNTYTISAPIDFTTNYWHFIALTYSSTNVSLYLDGQQLTNDPGGLNLWPGPAALANGMFFGSDSNGIYQAEGELDDVKTYNVVLSSNTVQRAFSESEINYFLNPWNWQFMQAAISSAPSSPTVVPTFNAIAGQGNLIWVANTSSCVTSSNVWLTNIVATMTGSGTNATMNVTFTIEGGTNGVPYDVFANSVLDFSSNPNLAWAWMGQGYSCNTYTLTNLPVGDCFLILGTPLDSDGDGLTDAYCLLVLKIDPNNPDVSGDGMLNGWKVMWGLSLVNNNWAQTSQRSNYSYDPDGRLQGVTGARSGTVSPDAEGNVQTVSQ
jgi:hypothetical protein